MYGNSSLMFFPLYFVSSPEQEVLKLSYSDRSLSVRQQLLKKTSLRLHGPNSQEASLGVPLQKYNKGSQLINNKMADFLFCFKNHL